MSRRSQDTIRCCTLSGCRENGTIKGKGVATSVPRANGLKPMKRKQTALEELREIRLGKFPCFSYKSNYLQFLQIINILYELHSNKQWQKEEMYAFAGEARFDRTDTKIVV